MNYKKQSLGDLISLFEINSDKITNYNKDKNSPPFIKGTINNLKVQNLELLKIINNNK